MEFVTPTPAVDAVRSLWAAPSQGALRALSDALGRREGDAWLLEFLQAGGLEVVLHALCMWSQYPAEPPAPPGEVEDPAAAVQRDPPGEVENPAAAVQCARCLYQILNTEPGLDEFLQQTHFTHRLVRCLDSRSSAVKKVVVDLLCGLCLFSRDAYALVAAALRDYQRDGEEAYLRVPVRELRETRDPGYQATLVALINCVLHNEPLPRRIHIRNVLNDLKLSDVLEMDVRGGDARVNAQCAQYFRQEYEDLLLSTQTELNNNNLVPSGAGTRPGTRLGSDAGTRARRLTAASAESVKSLTEFSQILLGHVKSRFLQSVLRSFVRDGDPERLAAALAPGLDEPDAPPPPPPPAPLLPDPGAGPPRRPFLPPTLQDDPNALGLFPTERPATKMKTFPWSKVNPDLNDGSESVWRDVLRLQDRFRVSEETLEETFALETPVSRNVTSAGGRRTHISLDAKRRIRVSLALRMQQAERLAARLRGTAAGEAGEGAWEDDDEEALTAKQLRTLLEIAPTQTELKEVQKLQGPTSELMEVERFFLLFRDFPHCADYQSYIEGLLLQRELPELCREHREALRGRRAERFRRGCDALTGGGADGLRPLLRAVLRAGNYLNCGTHHGGALGFRLSDLLRLREHHGTSAAGGPGGSTGSLLQLLVQAATLEEPTLLPDLAVCLQQSVADLTSLDVDGIAEELEALQKRLDELRAKRSVRDTFADFLQEADASLGEVRTQLGEVDELRGRVLRFYCADSEGRGAEGRGAEGRGRDMQKLVDTIAKFSAHLTEALQGSEEKGRRFRKQLSSQSVTSHHQAVTTGRGLLQTDSDVATPMDAIIQQIQLLHFPRTTAV